MIYQLLKKYGARGRQNAMTTKQLMRLTGLSQREITKAVERERLKHFICSQMTNGGGYYRPATTAEVLGYLNSQEKRIAKHALSMRLARRFKKRKTQTM